MNNLALYRKYRPQVFADVVGQEHIVKTLTNAVREGMVSHGYLFSGPHGCGKTTVARLFAKAINCQNRKEGDFEPCNKCDSCLEINQGNAIDLIEIDGATYTGVDNIRELQEGIRFGPVKCKRKVFIIDECHQLSKPAASALLKTLEEPPEYAIFILATTDSHKMIPTILSRCQTFYFQKLQLAEIAKRLEKILRQEKVKAEKEAIDMIAWQADGSQRDAESLLDEMIALAGKDGLITAKEVGEILGLADKKALLNFLDFLSQKKVKEAVEFLNQIMYENVDLAELAKNTCEYLRAILFLKIDSQFQNPLLEILGKEEKQFFSEIAGRFSEQEVKFALEKIMEAENKMRYASILQLPLELAVVEICIGQGRTNQP